MTNVVLGKRGRTLMTARNLARAIARTNANQCGVEINENVRNNFNLIRWGNSDNIRFRPQRILNSRLAIAENANKHTALVKMHEAGVRTPQFGTDKTTVGREIGFPLYGRTNHHQGGAGLYYIRNRFDLVNDNTSEHFLEAIPIAREYRIHVFNGDVIGVYRKVENEEFTGERNMLVRNLAGGWRFSMCDIPRVRQSLKDIAVAAVSAVGLDFGGVDIIVGEDNVEYVLEVNSAPALDIDGTIFDVYVQRFAQFFHDNPIEEEEDEDDEGEDEDEDEDEDDEDITDNNSDDIEIADEENIDELVGTDAPSISKEDADLILKQLKDIENKITSFTK